MTAPEPRTIVVVSHTHWDREWYQPLGVFRQRLASLIDTLLDEPDGLPFLLDGQAIVLDDYALVRPERMSALSAALREGHLEAGPWYVLADMQLPGAEALVRNLLEGTLTVRAAGGTPPAVLYSPDAFGHSAAGPVLAEGFGLHVAVVWRGFGGPAHPMGRVARWHHPSGASVLLYHLPHDGYEIGSSLPVAPDEAAARWAGMREAVIGRNPLGVSLLPNGADHHARQSHRVAAIDALGAAAAPDIVEVDSLSGFTRRLLHAADGAVLADVTGELRDSTGWTWALQGTLATRAHQKRSNARAERLLVCDVEPWIGCAWFHTGDGRDTLRTAWKTLLATHPHDTLCGCSVDEVAQAADGRWADVTAQARELRDDALRRLIAYDPAVQRDLEPHWQPTLVLCNPAARPRGGAVRLRLIDDIVSDPVGPGSGSDAHLARRTAPPLPAWIDPDRLQLLRQWRQFDRVESPQHYPRNAVVQVSEVVAWVADVAGYGVRPIPVARIAEVAHVVPTDLRVRATDTALDGPHWTLAHSHSGITAAHAASGARLHSLGWIESVTDAGDTYTPSLRGQPTVAQWSAPTVATSGPIRAEWQVEAHLDRPQRSVASAVEPSSDLLPTHSAAEPLAHVRVTATIGLDAGADRIDLTLRGENTACDHRLRWVLPLPGSVRADTVLADAAFGAVRRTHSTRDPDEWSAERRLNTAPMHRWLHLEGASYGIGIVSDGLAEYELLPDGHLAITLVRAVGELSRGDLPERPGHAGWPAATPLAQSLGAFEARIAIVALPTDRDVALHLLAKAADDVLLSVTGETWRGVGTELPAYSGLTLVGDGLVFSTAKRSVDGDWLVLRCVNQRGVAVQGSWQLSRPAAEARLSRLDETPGDVIDGSGMHVPFTAPPHGIVTLLVR